MPSSQRQTAMPATGTGPALRLLRQRAGRRAFHVLRLYIAGGEAKSQRALMTIRAICAQHLAGRHRLEVIDILRRPALARRDQIVALPTLVKISPDPTRLFIGDLSDIACVLRGLGIPADR